MWKVNGVDHEAVGDTTENIVKGIVVPIAIGAAFLAIFTTWAGWWKPAISDGGPVRPPWLLVVPVLFAPAIVLTLVVVKYGDVSFGESTATTGQQMVAAFVGGTVFYVTRMVTRTLVVDMILHALWDVSTLGIDASGGKGRPRRHPRVPQLRRRLGRGQIRDPRETPPPNTRPRQRLPPPLTPTRPTPEHERGSSDLSGERRWRVGPSGDGRRRAGRVAGSFESGGTRTRRV